MTVRYIIGAALSAAMWLGLIYVMVVEPTRLYLRKRAARTAEPGFILRRFHDYDLSDHAGVLRAAIFGSE